MQTLHCTLSFTDVHTEPPYTPSEVIYVTRTLADPLAFAATEGIILASHTFSHSLLNYTP